MSRVYSGVQLLHMSFAPTRGACFVESRRPAMTGTRCILVSGSSLFPKKMLKTVIVIHYHELWLKGRNRKFFLGKFLIALRGALAEFPGVRMRQPGDRVVIE